MAQNTQYRLLELETKMGQFRNPQHRRPHLGLHDEQGKIPRVRAHPSPPILQSEFSAFGSPSSPRDLLFGPFDLQRAGTKSPVLLYVKNNEIDIAHNAPTNSRIPTLQGKTGPIDWIKRDSHGFIECRPIGPIALPWGDLANTVKYVPGVR